MKCGLKATARTSKRHVIAANAALATCVPCAAVVRAERRVEDVERGPVKPELMPYYDWANGPDSGLSSKTIVQILTGAFVLGRWGFYAPADPDDFGRCHRVLKRFPELRSRLSEVAERCEQWVPLVSEWDALTRLYEEELAEATGSMPRLYARMRELLDRG